jgi:hypothetical protein
MTNEVNKNTGDALPAEYLFSCDGRRIKAFPIIKKTKHRIYYKRPGFQYYPPNEPDEYVGYGYQIKDKISFVDRIPDPRYRCHFGKGAQGVLYAEPPYHMLNIERVRQARLRLAQLKTEMAAAHPDCGGTNAAFIEARKRYVATRRWLRAMR